MKPKVNGFFFQMYMEEGVDAEKLQEMNDLCKLMGTCCYWVARAYVFLFCW